MKHRAKNDFINYRISRANETLDEVHELMKLGYLQTAVNRIYYACFYAVNALLLKHSIRSRTHCGVQRMFGLHFIKTKIISSELGKFYTDLFDKRHTGDYDDFVEFDKQTVNDLYVSAKEFVRMIEKLI